MKGRKKRSEKGEKGQKRLKNEEPSSKLLGIFVGKEIYYIGFRVHTQLQKI